MEKGFNLYSCAFTELSDDAEGIPLGMLKLEGAAGTLAENIQMLSAAGSVVETYWWLDASITGTTSGWYQIKDEGLPTEEVVCVDTKRMSNTQGFYIYSPTDNAVSVQTSGGVTLSPYSVTLNQGFNLVGNATPVDINIQKIKLEGAAGTLAENLQILDSDGNVEATYWWLDASITGTISGWYQIKDEGLPSEEVVCLDIDIPSGKGLYLYSPTANTVKFNLPSALGE